MYGLKPVPFKTITFSQAVRSCSDTKTRSLQTASKACVLEKRKARHGWRAFSFPLFLFYRIQRNFMPSLFPGKSPEMSRLQLAGKKNA